MEPGSQLGRYKIVRKIGEGGMGEVFLAEDPKLSRPVAVKILSADFTSDSDRMLRFIYEAKAASALNHPNIITIYEINDEGEAPFIAMEYVEGETLGRRMKAAPLEIHETIDIAIQVATALAAAHGASVVHRDVKPDNVILRPDGLVKVLDFGLAKQIEGSDSGDYEADGIMNVRTRPGLVMGTVAYMSPEQARGKLVDARSDIFGFGSMVYQMVSGRLPFTGENDLDVVSSILHKEPRALSESARFIPHDVEVLIKKALRKNRDERYQTMRELLADLKDIREDLRSHSSGARNGHGNGNGHISNGHLAVGLSDLERGMPTEQMPAADAPSTRELSMAPSTLSGILMSEIKAHPVRSLGFSVVAAALLVAIGIGIIEIGERFRKPDSFQTMKLDKLTFSGNVASEQAAVSPDGKYFAYVTEVAGEQGLWVKQTATDSNVRIVEPSTKRYNGITFSPDANYVYFTVIEKEGTSSLYQVSALGGTPRRIAQDAKGPIAFSPDGRRIVFVRKEVALIVANSDGSEARELAQAGDDNRWLRISWSPDGATLAVSYFSASDSKDHLGLLSIADGTRRSLDAAGWLRIRGLAWLPSSELLVSGRDDAAQFSQIWAVDPSNGSRRRVTNDLSSYQGISVTADGTLIVSTQQNTLSNLWVGSANTEAVRVTSEIGKSDGMSGISFSRDDRIFYTTRLRGTQDIWVIRADGTGSKQLTFNTGANFSPAVTPDGKTVIFVSTRDGSPALWRMDPDGDDQRRLTDQPGAQTDPDVTSDGQWVLYQLTSPDNKATIWKLPVAGGAPSQVTRAECVHPKASPDGRYFVCDYGLAENGSTIKTAVMSISDGGTVHIFNEPDLVRSRNIRWSADSRWLVYSAGKDRVDNLWRIPVEGGEPQQITAFTSDQIFRFDIDNATGRYVVARGSDTSDAVLISNFK